MSTASAPIDQNVLTARVWGMLLLLGVIWGGSFFFAKIAVAEIKPLVLVLERVAIAAVALQIYLAMAGPSFALARPLMSKFFILAILNNIIPFSLIFAGQTELGAGLASVLNATTPIWTLLIANALTSDEKLTVGKLIGVGLGIAGVAVMIGPGLIAGLGGPAWAKFALIGAAISYGFAGIFARRHFRELPAVVTATGQLTASTVIMVPVILSTYGPTALLAGSQNTWLAVLALALISTAFAYILFFRIIAAAGATNASLVTLLIPPAAILLGVLFLGERLELFELAGMALIGLGLVTIDGRLLSRRQH